MKILYALVSVLLIVVGFLVFRQFQERKIGFVYNNKVFEKFDGTIHLQGKLDNQRKTNKAILDSLSTLISYGQKSLENTYAIRKNELSAHEAQASEQYTAELWKFINDGIKAYGDQNGYAFIYGADGSGNLMYANEELDLTDEILVYINQKYQKGK